jgi:hypothetical protein
LGIDSLEGLNNVPKIETVRLLKLNNNNIQSIKAGELAAAINVKGLALTNNGLEDIESNAFAGLSNLWVLNLNSNNISLLPQDSLNGMTSIKILAIGDNPIAASEISALYKQIPSVWKIMSVPINKANLKKFGIRAAAIAGVALAVAGAAIGIKKATEKIAKSESENPFEGIETRVHEAFQGSHFENNLDELERYLKEARQECEEGKMQAVTKENLGNRLRWAESFMKTTQGDEAAREKADNLILEAQQVLLRECARAERPTFSNKLEENLYRFAMDINRSEKELKEQGSLSEVNKARLIEFLKNINETMEWQEALRDAGSPGLITKEQEDRITFLKQKAEALLKRESL